MTLHAGETLTALRPNSRHLGSLQRSRRSSRTSERCRQTRWLLKRKYLPPAEKTQPLNTGVQVLPSQGGKFNWLLRVGINNFITGPITSPQSLKQLSNSFTNIYFHALWRFFKTTSVVLLPRLAKYEPVGPQKFRRGYKEHHALHRSLFSRLEWKAKGLKINKTGISLSRNPTRRCSFQCSKSQGRSANFSGSVPNLHLQEALNLF